MVMLSELLRHRVADARGQQARLVDLAVDLSTGDYPTVTRLIYRGAGRKQLALPWEAVESADWRAGRLKVGELQAGRPAPPEALRRAVLLDRDVMDALVLDLANRSVTRANDLWLNHANDRLLLRAADVSPWAVLRRLGRGVLGRGADRSLLDWRDVEFLRGDPRAAQQGHDYHRRIASLPANEIAHLAEALPYLHAAELLTLIPDDVAADTLEAMSSERQLQVFEELDEDQAARILALMAPDIAADLLGRLDPREVQHWLNRLPPGQCERVTALLRYPEDTAGGIMTNDVIVVPERLSLPEARDALREPLAEPDFVYYVYAVDDERSRRLRGVLSLRDILIGRDNQSVSEVMRADVLTVDPRQSALEAAQLVADNGFAALPCVGPDGRLLGAITIDAAMEQLAPPSWRRQAPRVFS